MLYHSHKPTATFTQHLNRLYLCQTNEYTTLSSWNRLRMCTGIDWALQLSLIVSWVIKASMIVSWQKHAKSP